MRNALTNSSVFSALALLAALCTGCFVTEGLTEGKSKPARVNPPAPAPPVPPIVEGPHPDELDAPRLARRLALDLLNRFPAAADIVALTADKKAFPALVDSYLASAEANRSLSDLHPRMWRLRASLLPDLDAFVAAGDTALGKALTPAVRAEIVHEPALAVRLLLDRDDPFPTLFTQGFTVLHPAVAGLYGLTTGAAPWPGEPYVLADYSDGRPAGGVLVSNGILASFDAKSDPALKARSAKILTDFGCYRTEAGPAHFFYDLTAEELRSDLSELAATRKPCVGCHAQFHDQATAFGGLGIAATFSDWLHYTAPATEPAGRVVAGAFTGMADMAALIGADSRTHRCELERLVIELYQRRAGAHDENTLADGLTYFNAAGKRLKPAIRQILISPEYKYGPVPPALKTDHALVSTGVRVIKRMQWLGILRQLAYSAGALEVPDALDPGAGELASDLDHVPSGTYFHYADRLARQAATAIVNDELTAGATAATRRVFTMLPDGVGADAAAEQVKAQIRATWELLTTEVLTDASQTYLDLQTLYAGAAPDGTPDDFKRAWRVVLVAMLTHPAFLTY